MIIVVNPGTHPEPMHAAIGLGRLKEQTLYLTASSFAADSKLVRSGILQRIVPSLTRRILPKELTSENVRTIAFHWEMFFQVALRIMPWSARNFMRYRTRRFQLNCVRAIRDHTDVTTVVAQQTSAKILFSQLPGNVLRVLNYPIAHHRWLHREMSDEAKRNPEWAEFLQGNERTERELCELDLEIALADQILVASSFVKQTFIDFGVPESKLKVIPLGADMDLDSDDMRPREKRSGAALKVIFVGQMTQRKGMSYLVEAIGAVENCTLTVIGPAVANMDRKLAAQDRVKTISSLPRHQLVYQYASHDVLALPSLAEGFGLVALEAMRCGTPCIVTDRTFGTDVITHGIDGYVIPAADSASIRKVLREMASDSEMLKRMGERARSTAEGLSWDNYALAAGRYLQQINARVQ